MSILKDQQGSEYCAKNHGVGFARKSVSFCQRYKFYGYKVYELQSLWITILSHITTLMFELGIHMQFDEYWSLLSKECSIPFMVFYVGSKLPYS